MIDPPSFTFDPIYTKDIGPITVSLDRHGHHIWHTPNTIKQTSLMMRMVELDHGLNIPDTPAEVSYHRQQCMTCGDRLMPTISVITANQWTLRVCTPCPYPHGRPSLDITIPVPSGKILLGNDLRELAEGLEYVTDVKEYDLTVITQGESALYARGGMLYWFVGNSCPSIFQESSQAITVASATRWDTATDDYIDARADTPIGSICTDLWWVSAMDYDHARQRHKAVYPDGDWDTFISQCTIARVEPGDYTASIPEPMIDATTRSPHPITIQRVGPATLFVPPHAPTDTSILHGAMMGTITHKLERFPTLFGTPIDALVFSLCTLGNGMQWTDGLLHDMAGRTYDTPYTNQATMDGDTWASIPTMGPGKRHQSIMDWGKMDSFGAMTHPHWLACILLLTKHIHDQATDIAQADIMNTTMRRSVLIAPSTDGDTPTPTLDTNTRADTLRSRAISVANRAHALIQERNLWPEIRTHWQDLAAIPHSPWIVPTPS